MKDTPKETFMTRNKRLHLMAILSGLFPPGAKKMITSPILRAIFSVYSWTITTLGIIYIIGAVFALITIPVPMDIMFGLLRRLVSVCFGVFKLIAHNMVPSRRRRMDHLFEIWDNDINIGKADVKIREKLLAEQLRTARPIIVLSLVFGVGMLCVSCIPYLFNRYAKGSNFLFNIPHNPDASYHFLLAWMTQIFFLSNLSVILFNYFLIILLTMADTQIIHLKVKLAEIFSKVQLVDGEVFKVDLMGNETEMTTHAWEMEVQRVRKDLGSWIKNHRLTMNWIAEMTNYMTYTFGVNIVFLGLYACLVVFTLPNYISNKRYIDLLMILGFVTGLVPMIIHECTVAMKLHADCKLTFNDTYDKPWFIYPSDIRRAIVYICYYACERSVEVRVFSIIPENMTTYSSIMQGSYQALSFLLNMND